MFFDRSYEIKKEQGLRLLTDKIILFCLKKWYHVSFSLTRFLRTTRHIATISSSYIEFSFLFYSLFLKKKKGGGKDNYASIIVLPLEVSIVEVAIIFLATTNTPTREELLRCSSPPLDNLNKKKRKKER